MNTEIESIKTLTDTELKTVSSIRQLEGMVSLQPYYADDSAILFCGASEKVLPLIPANSIDLTVTSPPYDNLRTYKGFTFDFETIAKELYRVTKDGGVVVWVVNDATIDGSETLTSFKQAIFFKEQCGFNLHDTEIYHKRGMPNETDKRYRQDFEYMFVLSKGQPKTFNPIRHERHYKDKRKFKNINRGKDGVFQLAKMNPLAMTKEGNLFFYVAAGGVGQKDKIAYEHPATFPEDLAKDNIATWSNEGDVVLDCFNGSGTTMKTAKLLKRFSIGIDTEKEYCELTTRRIDKPMPLFNGLTS